MRTVPRITCIAGVLLAGLLLCGPVIDALSSPRPVAEQDPWRQYAGEYTVIENVLTDLYKAVSFGPGNECDWERLRLLCHPEVVFYQPPRRGSTAFTAYDLDAFIQFFKDDIERNDMGRTGFHERVGRHETTSFGRIAHSYVVFEIRLDPTAESPLQRGVDSVSLVLHEGRWWVSSIDTDYEFPGRQDIPDRILPGDTNR